MKVETIEQIINGLQVTMPSGIQAELSMDEEGNIIVKYMDDCMDIYSPEDFNQVILDGLTTIPIEQQSVLMEDKHTCCLDQLEFLSKHLKDTKLRQNAITLMDAAGLGVDVEEAVKKLWKEFKKNESEEDLVESINEDFGATGIIYPFRVICRDINGGAIDTDGHYKEKDAEEVFNDTVAENINDEVAEITLEKLEDGKYIKIKTWHPEDDWREVEFIEESLNEEEKPLAIRWEEEMKNYPVIETAQGEIYFEPSEDGTKIIYGTMTNGGIIPEGEIEYEADKSLDWHIQGLADEIFEKYGYPMEDGSGPYSDSKYDRLSDLFDESLDKKSILNKIAADVRAEVERVYDYDKDLIEWNYVEPHIKKGHYDDGSDMYYIEVRDELGYEGMQNLADKLNPIVRKYDKRAYFDMDEPGIMSAVIDMDTVKLDETSEEKAKGTEHKRIDNFVNSKLDNTDTKKNAKKLVKNSKIMAKRDDKKKDENMSELSKLTSELTGLMEEIDAEPKKCGLIDKLRKRFNKPEAKDEAFNDEIMLTDIEELDMPDALADTIDTNDEGEVLTLGDVADEIKDLKDEVIDAVAEIKDEITDKIEDKVEEEVDEIEFLDDMEAEAEEIEDEIKDTQEDAVDLEAEDAEEAAEAEDEEAGEEEIEEKEEEIEEKEEEVEIEESFKKYLRKGQLENLQDAKQEIDKDIRSGADTEDIKTDITIHSDTEEEEKKAKEYAASKLKECLETSKTSILSKELK